MAAMPRFYIHVSDGNLFAEDEAGIELADVSAARDEAIKDARDIMAAAVQRGELDLGSFIEVEDENRNYLFTVTFADALEVKGRHQGPERESERDHTQH